MYLLFHSGAYQGEYKNYPWTEGFPYYIYATKSNKWYVQTSISNTEYAMDNVPKEYLLLNLLLGNSTCTDYS